MWASAAHDCTRVPSMRFHTLYECEGVPSLQTCGHSMPSCTCAQVKLLPSAHALRVRQHEPHREAKSVSTATADTAGYARAPSALVSMRLRWSDAESKKNVSDWGDGDGDGDDGMGDAATDDVGCPVTENGGVCSGAGMCVAGVCECSFGFSGTRHLSHTIL
jgi:hypothetical protein